MRQFFSPNWSIVILWHLTTDDNVIVWWCDSKAVNLLSSFVGIEPLDNVRLLDQKAKTHIVVPRPAIVDNRTSSWEALTLIYYRRCSNSPLDPEGGTCTFGGTLSQWQ